MAALRQPLIAGLVDDLGMAITSVRFSNFKALRDYSVSLQSMNVLVGPNNSGKSTVLSAFRVLEQAMRTARSRRATRVGTHSGGQADGHFVPETNIPISLENVHSDYTVEDSRIEFRFSNGNKLFLFFPSGGGCNLYWDVSGRPIATTTAFRREFPVQVQVIPVLGPIEQEEEIVTDETVRYAAGTPRASRHFRNFWYKNPDGFDEFQSLVERTWPGMSIGRPEITSALDRRLVMFCSENRIDRELYWSGLGFQVWCQLLTHISRGSESDLLIVDEPEVYLHPDIQRQLLGILRDVRPDIVLATHSTEILGEADPGEILLMDKTRRSAKRLRDAEGVQQALDVIGSIQNITLTQLARNRRLLFVEGLNDYKIIRRFAKNMGLSELAAGNGISVLESGGFSSWSRVQALAWGFKKTLGDGVKVAAIYDRDYWCDEEIDHLNSSLGAEIQLIHIHQRKEIENYLLVPQVLSRLITRLVSEKGSTSATESDVFKLLDILTAEIKTECQGQFVSRHCKFHRNSGRDQSTLTSDALTRFDRRWGELDTRMSLVPGKKILKSLREQCKTLWGTTLTDVRLVDAVQKEYIPKDLVELLEALDKYRAQKAVT